MTTEITVFKKFEADLVAFEEHNADLTFDTSTAEGLKACEDHHRKLRKLYNGVDKLRKKTGEEYRQKVTDINEEAKTLLSRVDTMANPFKAQIDAEEQKVRDEINRIAAEAEAIKALEQDERLAYINNQEFDFKAREAEIIVREDAAKAKEKEAQAEINRIARDKQIEAEKVIAAEKARKEAEAKAEQAAKDAAELAEKEKEAAILAEQQKAHDLENDRIAKELEAKLKQDEADEAERVRVADIEHRDEIEISIVHAMAKVIQETRHFSPNVMAEAILAAISEKEIPHIEIKY